MIPLFRKNTGVTLLCALLITQGTWFWVDPADFKKAWSKNPLVAHIIREHALVQEKAKIVAISYYLPHFEYFAGIVSGTEQPKKEWMESYYQGKPYIFHTFYQKTVDLFPAVDAAHFLLGFCEYYMGNPDTARAQYEKSIDLNPYFFWAYYDLGVIYYNQGDFYKSAVVLNKALSLKKEIALEILRQSPLYLQIWRYVANPPQTLQSNLDEGQVDAALLLAASFIKAGGYPQALQIIQSFGKNSAWHQGLQEELSKKAISKQKATDDIDRLVQEQIPVRLF